MSYTYVKRLSRQGMVEAQEIVNSLNELAPESAETTGILGTYSLDRTQSGYWIVTVVFSDGGEDTGSIVRCQKCGGLRDLWDGQFEFCLDCNEDW